MIEVLKSLSDDQIALLGCATALCVAGTIMSLSYYIGRARNVIAGQKPLAEGWPTKERGAVVVSIPTARRRDAA